MWLSLMQVVLQTNMKHRGCPRGIDRHLAVAGSEDLARGRGTSLTMLQSTPSEPELGDKDVHIDDIPVGDHTPQHIVHLQPQDSIKWAHDGPYLAHDTCGESRRHVVGCQQAQSNMGIWERDSLGIFQTRGVAQGRCLNCQGNYPLPPGHPGLFPITRDR